jgi:hypothetical protein
MFRAHDLSRQQFAQLQPESAIRGVRPNALRRRIGATERP